MPSLTMTTLELPFGASLTGLSLQPTFHHKGRGLYVRELMRALEEPGTVVLESLPEAERIRVERLLASVDETGQGRATLLGPDGHGQVEETFSPHPEAELVIVERTLQPLDAAPEPPAAAEPTRERGTELER